MATMIAVKVALRVLLLAFVLMCGIIAPRVEAAPLMRELGGTSGFGTLAMGRNDDGSSGVIALGSGFPFGIKLFSGSYTNLYINNNGNLTFKAPLGTYTPSPFPITNLPMLAAFWGDVDTRGGVPDPTMNNVYYSTAIAGKFIVTWNYVGYYSGGTNKLNAFQIVLTDRSDIAQGDFDIEYRYEQLQWTTGSASGGSNGLGGTPAQMGYDAGDGKNYYRHPDSQTANILKLVETSNVNDPGVWKFEVRGGTPNPVRTPNLTNVRLVQTLNAGDIDVDAASFAVQPYGISSANGQTFIEWRFDKFPADATKELSYDVVFKNPLPGENRLLVSKLELVYNDVNNNTVRTELGSEYVNVYPSIYQVTPATDKASYSADQAVQISSAVKNLSGHAGIVGVKLSVLDANNALVSALGTVPVQTLAAGATGIFGGLNFMTGSTYAGSYKVLAEAVDNTGNVVAFGTVPFAIGVAGGTGAKAAIVTDKQGYNPFDTVRVSSRVTNTLSNASLDDARAITTVRNPDGSVRFTKTETLQQLPPGQLKDYLYDLALASAPAGQYSAALVVTKADGTQLAQASTAFSVGSTADTGAGLVGTLATPAWLNAGQSAELTFNATNNGNGQLANVPLKVAIVDPDKQQVVAEFPYAATLPVGGTYSGTAKWIATVDKGATYVAVLTATVGGKMLTLAQATIAVLKLDIKHSVHNGNRVLVLVSCNDESPDATTSTEAQQCETQRSQAIDAVLAGMNVPHLIATDESAFKHAFRSGIYNTYWISGKQDKLHGDLAAEIREAVFAGDGLILDGVHDQRNKVLDAVAGIAYRGKLGETGLTVGITGPVFEAQTLATVDRSLKLLLNGGVQQAVFDVAKPDSGSPAIVTQAYGTGRSVMYAFDFVNSVQAQPLWQPVLAASLQHVLQVPSGALVPGALIPVKTGVTNQGPATDIAIKTSLPQGATLMGSNPTGSHDAGANTVEWAFSLAEAQTRDVFLTLRVPPAAGDFTLQTTISTTRDGTSKPYGDPLTLPFKVTTAVQASVDAANALKAYVLTQKSEQKARDAVLAKLQEAMMYFNRQTAAGYESAISALVQAIDQLSDLTAVDTGTVRLGLDRILKEAAWRWTATQGN